jgi:endonuclease V
MSKDFLFKLPYKQNVDIYTDEFQIQDNIINDPENELKKKWKSQQRNIFKKAVFKNKIKHDDIKLIAGIDISFAKNSKTDACVGLVVLKYPKMDIVVYESYSMVNLTQPYIPGFLAFREADHIIQLLNNLKKDNPKFMPDVIMLDGNGTIHYSKVGIAVHIGVLTGIPCFGVAKNLLYCNGLNDEMVEKGLKDNKYCKLVGDDNFEYGYAVEGSDYPLYVSPGSNIDLETCLKITLNSMLGNNLPEPTFLADLFSRKFLRLNYFKFIKYLEEKS